MVSFPALIAGCLAVLVFGTLRTRMSDPDLFWHLRNAQYFMAHHRLLSHDIFSYTVPGAAWIDHEWLSELLYYAGYHALGWQGIYLVAGALLAAIVVSVFYIARAEGADLIAAVLVMILGALLMLVGFGPRMQHLGWLCFVAILAILLRYRSARQGPLWLLPLLFCIWINAHGGWLIGGAVCALIVAAGLVRQDVGILAAEPWSAQDLKRLMATGAASVAALFVNPYGYRLVLYPFDVMFRQKLNVQYVQEWLPVNFRTPHGKIMMAALLAVLVGLCVGQKRWRVHEILLACFAVMMPLIHVRLLLLAGIVLPVILGRQFSGLSTYDPSQERPKLNVLLFAVLALICVLKYPSTAQLWKPVEAEYPAGAVAYIRDHELHGRVFQNYDWGGYFEWTLPETKVFIDSRTDIFEYAGVLKDYADAVSLVRSREVLDKYGIEYVVIERDSALAYLLNNTRGWRCTYNDKLAAIFERAPGGL